MVKLKNPCYNIYMNAKIAKYLAPLLLSIFLFLAASFFLQPLDARRDITSDANTQVEGMDHYVGFPLYYLKRMTYMGDQWWGTKWRLGYLFLDFAIASATGYAVYAIFKRETK